MRLSTYTINQGETLELIAQFLLGDIGKTDTLIKINRLRYPYISDNPIDQFAFAKGTARLVGSYTDASSITISNINAVTILSQDTIYVQQGINRSSAVVKSISGSTISFVDPLLGSFDQSAILTIFANQQNITTQVLRTGDTLLYPQDAGSSNSQQYELTFGTDWQLDDAGFLKKENGDIARVSGYANLAQALLMRFKTAIGSLNLHREYGNKLYTILGEAGTSYFFGLAKYYAIECGSQDPRVQAVDVVDLSTDEDQLYFTLLITPKGSQEQISQPISIPIGGAM